MSRELSPGHDTVLRHALLGVQFRSALDGRVVHEGLQVDLTDRWRPGRAQRLAANPQGIFVVHQAPGLPGVGELPPPAAADSPPQPPRFAVEARDALGRWLPTRLALDLPHRGLLDLPPVTNDSPPLPRAPHVPLYPAPAQPLGAALAVVRADLRRATNADQPVPWARVELLLDGEVIATGVSDARGSLLLAGPLPAPREALLPSSPPASLPLQSWTVTLRAFWHPDRLADGPLADASAVQHQPEVPLLGPGSPPTDLPPRPLAAGVPLIVTSGDHPVLLVAA